MCAVKLRACLSRVAVWSRSITHMSNLSSTVDAGEWQDTEKDGIPGAEHEGRHLRGEGADRVAQVHSTVVQSLVKLSLHCCGGLPFEQSLDGEELGHPEVVLVGEHVLLLGGRQPCCSAPYNIALPGDW